MTARDFMSYLIYVEHAAENLQFYLWYKDYEKRFHDADTVDIKLAPEWTQAMQEDLVAKLRKDHVEKMRKEPAAAAIFKGTDFEKQKGAHELTSMDQTNPFNTPPRTPNKGKGEEDSIYASSTYPMSSNGFSYKSQASEAFQSAGAKLPCKSNTKHVVTHHKRRSYSLCLASHHPAFPRRD